MAAFALVLAAAFTADTLLSHANTVYWYPQSCLGGWINPANAAGAPELQFDASADSFNADNSAMLENSISQIFCGTWNGDIPAQTVPTSVVLKLSWAFKTAPTSGAISQSDPIVSTTPADASSSLVDASSTDATATDTAPTTSDTISPSPAAVSASDTPPSDTPSSGAPAPTSTSPSDAPPPAEVVTPSSTTSTSPVDAAPPADTISPATSLLGLVPVALADDSASLATTVTPAASTSDGEISTTTVLVPTDAAATDTPAATDTTTTAPAPEEGILELRYSIDGQNWQSLGTITDSNWQQAQFIIPISTWDDLRKLQVGVVSLPTSIAPPVVYLDGMSLTVDYAAATSTDEAATSTPPTAPTGTDLAVPDVVRSIGRTLYSRSPGGNVVSSTVNINFRFGDWGSDMDFTDIYGNQENYWWIEVDSKAKAYPSPCYPSTTLSASPSFTLPPGDYIRVSVNGASSLDNCNKLFGGMLRPEGEGYAEPANDSQTTLFTVSQ